MSFSFASLFAGFVFGAIGFWLIKEAKRRVNYTLAAIGMALILVPYFVSNVWVIWAGGVALCAYAYLQRHT